MTPLFKKLNFKNQEGILAVNPPESFESELKAMAEFATVYKNENDIPAIEFVIVFVTRQNEIDESIREIYSKLKGDATIWYCYPKGSSKKYKCDFNRDTGWDGLGKSGLEPVRQVAIDEDWSALRFRRVEFIKTMVRNFAISDEGKKRTGKINTKKNQT